MTPSQPISRKLRPWVKGYRENDDIPSVASTQKSLVDLRLDIAARFI